MSESLYSIPLKKINGQEATLKEYEGKLLLIVNVASECGFTPQYEGLEQLYHQYQDQGLVVLGFPCNQFGSQEPGTEEQIQNFCDTRFKIHFPMYAKVEVNGPGTHPLYAHLKQSAKGFLGTEGIKWNFTKFLVSQTGEVLDRFAPQTAPKDLEPAIKKALAL